MTTEGIAIRTAGNGDIDALASIAIANPTAPQWTAAQFHQLLRPRGNGSGLCRSALVATRHGGLVGFAVISALHNVFPAEAELESLAVLPDLQHGGIGRSLVEAAVAWATNQGATALRLEVRESNERALRIYRAAAFQQTGVRPGYYKVPREDAIVMERSLLPAEGDAMSASLA